MATYSGYVGNPYTVGAKQTATVTNPYAVKSSAVVTAGTTRTGISSATTDYMGLVHGDSSFKPQTYSVAVDFTPETYSIGVDFTPETYSINTTDNYTVREWGDELKGTDDELQRESQTALLRFLENPTLYKSAVDESGRTAYDLARQRVSQESQTQRDRTIEQLRGNLAAQGITGPAAEQMIANAMVQSDIQKAQSLGELSAQELATIDQFAREAQLQAAGLAGDIYGQRQELESRGAIAGAQLTSAERQTLEELELKEALGEAQLTSEEKQTLADLRLKADIAGEQLSSEERQTLAELRLKAETASEQMTSEERQTLAELESRERQTAAGLISDELITRLRGEIEKDLQTSALESEMEIKARMDQGYNTGASDRLKGAAKTDAELKALGYDDNQISAYRSGFSGMDVKTFEAERDLRSQLIMVASMNPDLLTPEGIDSIVNGVYGGNRGTGGGTTGGTGTGGGNTTGGTGTNAVYQPSVGKIVNTQGEQMPYNELTTMFRNAGAYGEPTTALYNSLKDIAPTLNLAIGNKARNEFNEMPTVGQVYVVNGRPMVVKETAERIGGNYRKYDYNGNMTETDKGMSGREGDTFVLVDLKTGKEQAFTATEKDISRAKSINSLNDWSSGLE